MAYVELSTKLFLTMDEVKHIQRQEIVSLIAHVFRLAYAAMVDSLVHEEKMRNCHGCAIQRTELPNCTKRKLSTVQA